MKKKETKLFMKKMLMNLMNNKVITKITRIANIICMLKKTNLQIRVIILKSAIVKLNLVIAETVNALKDTAIALQQVFIANQIASVKNVTINQNMKMSAKKQFKRRRNVLKMLFNL